MLTSVRAQLNCMQGLLDGIIIRVRELYFSPRVCTSESEVTLLMKKKWYSQIGNEKIEVIECLDSGSQRVWIKFEPVDKSKTMEVCNILDQPNKVSWRYRNSHFETINQKGKSNYYEASSAGSLQLDAGKTTISKDIGSKVIVFPLEGGVSLDVRGYTLSSDEFEITVNKPTWVGYAVSGSGSINPV